MNIFDLLKIKELFSLKEWWEDRKYGKHNELRALARRVLKVLDAHHIPVSRVPFVFPEFDLEIKDFKNLDSVISILNESFLDAFSKHFFINRHWLDTGEGSPQEQYEHGYNLRSFYDYLVNLEPKEGQIIVAHFFAQTGTEFVPAYDHDTHQGLVVVLEFNEYGDDDGFEYDRYQLLYIGYWHYYKTRMMIKAISLICFQLNIIQKGHFSKLANYRGMENHLVAELYQDITADHWYPDDYILTSEKSACSKDRADAEIFHQYLKEINCFDKIKSLKNNHFL